MGRHSSFLHHHPKSSRAHSRSRSRSHSPRGGHSNKKDKSRHSRPSTPQDDQDEGEDEGNKRVTYVRPDITVVATNISQLCNHYCHALLYWKVKIGNVSTRTSSRLFGRCLRRMYDSTKEAQRAVIHERGVKSFESQRLH